jgi:hypothetical protein
MLVVLLGLISMRDDSLVVYWGDPNHLVFCCFGLGAVSGWGVLSLRHGKDNRIFSVAEGLDLCLYP